ncbi:ABC transporter permease [Clostridium estertheticum]|uniref:ABC transporter permease n=1 Tax=Clostridium estertheticum TaxID=238834 RepID=UPI001CF5FE52|nr:ABC transporter permease [Clostridium estertheticum]MCB2308110.1 ABC transporter permease [Clostridium estertheticum]MCB2346310.1 ABC transporter permease [Clostridium estertheticum]MCB2349498.1 ABC transporter permease [Clostridium estertheticum]WAG46472.1 ABC transporter permease [Clostridium estertheticum]
MFNLIHCEFLKLKKSYLFLTIAIIILIPPILLYIKWHSEYNLIIWDMYLFQEEISSTALINLPMYVFISSYSYTREFSYNTAQTLFSYSTSRPQIFISKFLTIVIMTSCIMILQLLFAVLAGLLLPHEPLAMGIVLGHVKMNFYILVAQYAILPIAIFIAQVSRNMILPMVYGGIITVFNMSVTQLKSGIIEYLAITYPIQIMTNSFKTNIYRQDIMIINNSIPLSIVSIMLAISTFTIGITMCITYYLKTDIT